MKIDSDVFVDANWELSNGKEELTIDGNKYELVAPCSSTGCVHAGPFTDASMQYHLYRHKEDYVVVAQIRLLRIDRLKLSKKEKERKTEELLKTIETPYRNLLTESMRVVEAGFEYSDYLISENYMDKAENSTMEATNDKPN